jgi:Rrf2 family protein
MKISTRGRYGVRAMFELAKHYGSFPVSAKEIAQSQDIPPAYLEQILNKLQRAHLVRGVRGTGGGFLLGRQPQDIHILDIVCVLENSVSPVDCVDEIDTSEQCPRSDNCVAHFVWKRLDRAIRTILEGTNLADLCQLEEQIAYPTNE